MRVCLVISNKLTTQFVNWLQGRAVARSCGFFLFVIGVFMYIKKYLKLINQQLELAEYRGEFAYYYNKLCYYNKLKKQGVKYV